jgi:hypothetical protein
MQDRDLPENLRYLFLRPVGQVLTGLIQVVGCEMCVEWFVSWTAPSRAVGRGGIQNCITGSCREWPN